MQASDPLAPGSIPVKSKAISDAVREARKKFNQSMEDEVSGEIINCIIESLRMLRDPACKVVAWGLP